MMQTKDRKLAISSSTLNTLIVELGIECQNVLVLINQLQLPDLTPDQRSDILAELLSATVHLQTHCDESFQTLILEEMASLPEPTH